MEARGCGLINACVIPAKVGIQANGQGVEIPAWRVALEVATTLDFKSREKKLRARCAHTSPDLLRLKARDFNHPREGDINQQAGDP